METQVGTPKYKVHYKDELADKMGQPMEIDTCIIPMQTGVVIEARTDGRYGCEVVIFDYKVEMERIRFNQYKDGICYEEVMAKKIAEVMNILIEPLGVEVTGDELYTLSKLIRDKCESRYGVKLPNYSYEISVYF